MKMEFQLIGGTGIYLSEEFREIITAVIDIDSRGRIGPQEIGT